MMGVGEVERRQVSYLVLGETEPDAVGVHVADGADRNGEVMPAPQVPLLEQHMRHVMIVGIDDKSLNPTDGAIAGMHMFAAAHLHLSRRHTIADDDLGTDGHPHATHASAEPVIGPRQRLSGSIAHLLARVG